MVGGLVHHRRPLPPLESALGAAATAGLLPLARERVGVDRTALRRLHGRIGLLLEVVAVGAVPDPTVEDAVPLAALERDVDLPATSVIRSHAQ